MAASGRWRITSVASITLFILITFYVFYAGMIQSPFKHEVIIAGMVTVEQCLVQESPFPWLHNIFFVESSCALMNISSNSFHTYSSTGPLPGLHLSPRVACAIEAAARANPRRPVYLAHTCPLVADMWSTAPEYALQVLSLPNVRLWPVDFSVLAKGTVVETLLLEGKLAQSKWSTVHASDALRMLLLRRYGGTYLDTDVLVLQSMDDLKNFAVPQDPDSVNNAVLDFASDVVGREVADACLKELEDFRSNQWGYQGPQLVTRVLSKRCNTNLFTHVTPKSCGGFNILPTSTFYQVHWTQWKRLFEENGAEDVLKTLNNSIGVHIWNAMNEQKLTISLSSMQPLAQIMRRVCPSVVAAVGVNNEI